MKLDEQLLQMVISMILAVFGGTARLIQNTGKKKTTLKHFLTGAFVAAFTGFVVYNICVYNEVESSNMVMVVVSMAGYLGPTLLDIIGEKIFGKAPEQGKK